MISKEAGHGVNFLQQLFKDGKEPGVEKFLSVLDVLGTASSIYVLTGRDFTKEDEAFIKVALDLDPGIRQTAADLLRALLAQESAAAREPAPEG